MIKGCAHEDFTAKVDVGRLTNDTGNVTSFMADVRIECAQCHRQFQFLGLPSGIDTGGSTVSVDGTEAHLAICPAGEVPSTLDRISVYFSPEVKH